MRIPRTGSQSKRKCLTDLRFDNTGHLIGKNLTAKQLRCAYCSKEKPTTLCIKCKRTLYFVLHALAQILKKMNKRKISDTMYNNDIEGLHTVPIYRTACLFELRSDTLIFF